MKPHGFIRVIRKWHGMCINPVLRCFDNPEGLNNGDLPSWHSFRICELANGLRIGTIMPSQDLSGAWVTFAQVRASKGKYLSIRLDRG
jgi:hypothetical protein